MKSKTLYVTTRQHDCYFGVTHLSDGHRTTRATALFISEYIDGKYVWDKINPKKETDPQHQNIAELDYIDYLPQKVFFIQ